MELLFRRALPEDVEEIVSFTRNTWEWGDYVPKVIGRWVEEGAAYVAEVDGVVAAVAALRLVGRSAYLQGLRVRPEMRGRGIGLFMTRAMAGEARRLGARVAALLVAEWNEASRRAVERAGFRHRLTVYGGVAASPGGGRCLSGLEAYEAVSEALGRTGGYGCLPDEPWTCTALTAWDVLDRGRPCLEGHLYVGRFSFGPARGPQGADVTAVGREGFAKLYSAYLLYALEL